MPLHLVHWKRDETAGDREKERDPQRGSFTLWCEVIRRAMDDLDDKDPRNRHSAHAWFTSVSLDICSFLWVCEMLGVDPDRIRIRVFETRIVSRPEPVSNGQSAFYEWREARRLTLGQVAFMLHCSPVTVRNIEQGILNCGQFVGPYLKLVGKPCAASTA